MGAHLTELRRTAVGRFRVEDALPLDALQPGTPVPEEAWISPLEALGHLPRQEVGEAEADALSNGRILPAEGRDDLDPLVLSHDGELVAVAEIRDGRLRPRKVFRTQESGSGGRGR